MDIPIIVSSVLELCNMVRMLHVWLKSEATFQDIRPHHGAVSSGVRKGETTNWVEWLGDLHGSTVRLA
jgi:hypothetical protein